MVNKTTLLLIEPTRKRSAKERREFDRIVANNPHLTAADARPITDLAILNVRIADSDTEVKKTPNIQVPQINRSTGNIVGHKPARNPAFATLREARVQAHRLDRQLLIGPQFAAKRLRLLTKQAQAAQAIETEHSDSYKRQEAISEQDIEGLIDYWHRSPAGLIDRPDNWKEIADDHDLLRLAAIELLQSDEVARGCSHHTGFANRAEWDEMSWINWYRNDFPFLSDGYLEACGCRPYPETVTFADGDSISFR